GAAALLGAVVTAPSQVIYWTSADEHVMATLGALAALALYFEYRTSGRRLYFAAAILLAAIAALTKFEGTAVVFGVLAYELVWRPHPPYSSPSGGGRGGGSLALRVAPFAIAAGLFYAWEISATDRLRSAAQVGPHMILRAGQVLRA